LAKRRKPRNATRWKELPKKAPVVIEDTDEGTATRDVALILAGQKAEHYEIATYGGLAQIAQTLGLDDIATLLESTLQEEKAADEKLTGLAEGSINEEATHE